MNHKISLTLTLVTFNDAPEKKSSSVKKRAKFMENMKNDDEKLMSCAM